MIKIDNLSEVLTVLVDNLPLTLVLIGVVVLLNILIVRLIFRNSRLSAEARRRWVWTTRNALVGIFILGIVLIWAPQLRTVAAALIAIALALVLATKELISCVMGGILRVSTNAYGIGDRIEIGSVRGNVVDHNWLTTTVLEIGPGQTTHQYTGRAMVVPNSLLLTTPVTNETYTKKYVLHVTRIPLKTVDDWQSAEKILLEAAWAHCGGYLERAKKYMKDLEGRHWLDSPSVEPRVTIQLRDADHVDLLLRVPCLPEDTARFEQTILRHFLSSFTYQPPLSTTTPHSQKAPKPRPHTSASG